MYVEPILPRYTYDDMLGSPDSCNTSRAPSPRRRKQLARWQMIAVASLAKPLQMKAKRLPRRKSICADYSSGIDKVYEDVESSAHNELEPPAQWDGPSALLFVRDVVTNTLKRTISDSADIFWSSSDRSLRGHAYSPRASSRRVTRIIISRAIRNTNQDAARRVPSSAVFDAPPIASLAATVSTLVQLVRYNQPRKHARLPRSLDVVLITGSFGCERSSTLLRDASIAWVDAFNRKGTDAVSRQQAQFHTRCFDDQLLDVPQIKVVEDVLHELAPKLFEETRGPRTHIARNVDLAISSPFTQAPTILFVSSVSVFTNYEGQAPAHEAALVDLASAFGAGCSESKWVTERVLQNAAEERGIHSIVMRLGKVAGDRTGPLQRERVVPRDRQVGAIPAMSARPRRMHQSQNIVWVPGYEGAKAFTELRHSPEPFVHLVHPRRVVARAELGVPLVSHSEWLSVLQRNIDAAGADEVELMKANPALRLLQFYRGCRASPEREPFWMVYLSKTTSGAVSHALADLSIRDAGRVK
ncbi:hypothetical protein BD413DRAFT_496274 [Trametes elegans]|nr:hypothetical protein BD413DRAFT_496274 [Trametes elegans]